MISSARQQQQRQRRKERETLGTRLIWPDIRQTGACATFCFRMQARKHGRKRKEKEKNSLGLALAFMLTSARFHDMCCFTCTYAYVRVPVTSENKTFMLLPMPAGAFKGQSFLLHLRVCLRG